MALQLAAIGVVSLIAYFTKNTVFWMVAGAMGVVTGFYWFDRFTDNLGLSFGIMFLIYGINCFAVGFRQLFTRTEDELTEE